MKKKHEKETALWMSACVCLLVGTALAQVETNRLAREIARDAQANEHQPPGKVMDIIGLAPGMNIAEIGAGRGRVVIHLADRVGPNGKVYAEDINAEALRHLAQRCRRGGFSNVETILGDLTDPKLPAGTLDLIFVISSYHHFSDPVALMRSARPALKATGRLAIAEWIPEEDGRGEGTSLEKMTAQMESAGFTLERVDKSLEANELYICLFRLRSGG